MGKCPEPTPPQQPTGESPLRRAYHLFWALERMREMHLAMMLRSVPEAAAKQKQEGDE